MKTLTNRSFKNKKVLIRVDFNVPLNEKLQVVDNTRIYYEDNKYGFEEMK